MSRPALRFTKERVDRTLIAKIGERAEELELVKTHGERLALEMDINAVHSNGNPLRLAELLSASVVGFTHDVTGIRKHIDRRTGKLKNFFLPRFSQPEPVTA